MALARLTTTTIKEAWLKSFRASSSKSFWGLSCSLSSDILTDFNAIFLRPSQASSSYLPTIFSIIYTY
jgi:hypothetical protein